MTAHQADALRQLEDVKPSCECHCGCEQPAVWAVWSPCPCEADLVCDECFRDILTYVRKQLLLGADNFRCGRCQYEFPPPAIARWEML